MEMRRHQTDLVDSTKAHAVTPPGAGPQGPVRADEFTMVGVFDVDWLVEPRFQRLLDNMAASPGAFTMVRFFGSLNSGTRENTTPAGGGIVWPSGDAPMDFSATFDALEALTSRGLVPFIVLSFFPTAVSPSPTVPPTAFDNWKRLIQGFLEQLAADRRFGASAIGDWWFEVWNEPNVAGFWRGSFSQYLDLYRATSEAVTASGYSIRLGGPALAYAPNITTPLMAAFLTFLSNEPAVKCDFLSLHQKGTSGMEDPDLQRLVAAAEETASVALAIDPDRFRGMPIINNEADMKAGFDIPYEPRMTEQFPAWLTGVMIAYDALTSRFSDAGIRFLAASDNANQQLIQAPFDGRRSIMTRASASPHDLFKLPVYQFYEVLRLVGDRHGTVLRGSEYCFPHAELFHAITLSADHIASIFCVYPRAGGEPARAWTVDYTIVDMPWQRVNVARFQIDRRRTNAYTAAGRTLTVPVSRTAARHIRRAQELAVFEPIQRDVALTGGAFEATFTVEPFTVLLYWVTPCIPDPPADLSEIEAVVEGGNVILRWTPSREPFFYSYEIYLMIDGAPVGLLSPVPLRAAMWVDSAPSSGTRIYGVRAISASGIASPMVTSKPVSV